MPPANYDVNLFILDAGLSTSQKNKEDGTNFFEKSKSCIMWIVERLIFSRPTDSVGLLVMGSKQTNNSLAHNNLYQNISVAMDLNVPTWNFIETIRDDIKSSEFDTDWMDAILVAADLLNTKLGSKKVTHKKIVLFTDLKTCPVDGDERIDQIIKLFNDKELELIVIGPDIWVEEGESEPTELISMKSKQHQAGELLLKKLISEMNVIACTFEEAIHQILFYKKKATRPQAWNVDLCIGPDIAIPVSGFGKIRDDKSITNWKKVYKNSSNNVESIASKKSYFKTDDNTAEVDELDIVQGYLYGQTIVPYTKLDKTMEYQSGQRCLTVFGFTKGSNIHWNNLVGDGTTYILSRKDDSNSAKALDAFVSNLSSMNLVAVARRVYNKGNAPHMYVLFPIIENNCKFLSMVALAYKEDYRYMTFPSFNQKKFACNSQQIECIDELIDAMDLSRLDEDEKELFSIENAINPTLQQFFDTISYRALNPQGGLPPLRPEVSHLLQVPPVVLKLSEEPIKKIIKNFELVIKEKPQGGKHWVDQQLKSENNNKDASPVEEPVISPPTAISVMIGQVTVIGTADPVEDFKSLLSYGEPFDTVSEQMFDVIERLAQYATGNNYSKPLSALKVLREESITADPVKYNSWLGELKHNLLARSKKMFLIQLNEKKLGLITANENSASSVTEEVAKNFGILTEEAVEPDDLDVSELDDLF